MMRKRVRMTVTEWTECEVRGAELVVVDEELPREALYVGAQLNLLLVEEDAEGRLHPQHIVLDPDYLIDVTAICRCVTAHGDTPLAYLLQLLLPTEATAAIQLGAVANQFLDDCVGSGECGDEALYRRSLKKVFEADPLRFSTVDGIDAEFAQQCRQHFQHIRATMREHPVEHGRLEAAFLCEALGIQGRMDLMSGDAHTIVELKSGKGAYTGRADGRVAYRYEHALQMALYKESLYYNLGLPYAQVQTLLFYSRYPALIDIHLGRADIHRAIGLRNGIVALMRRLRTDATTLLTSLREEDFNVRGRDDRFYHTYLRPPILRLIETVRQADPLAIRYVGTMLSFVAREQALAKAEAQKPHTTQAEEGNYIGGLHLTPLQREDGIVTGFRSPLSAEAEQANFRPGDLVMLHAETDAAFYVPCVVGSIDADGLLLHLRYPQRTPLSTPHPAPPTPHSPLPTPNSPLPTTYSLSPLPTPDSSFHALYRGLFALLETTPRRWELVLHARHAEDLRLLVGPPGTGKTSVAIRQMVMDFLKSDAEDALLLTAYTNRAVDELCMMLSTLPSPHPIPYTRIGPELAADPAWREQVLTVAVRRHPTREGIRRLLRQSRIVVGTVAALSAAPELFRLKRFAVAIVDEASQVLEPQLLPLLCACVDGREAIGRFILVGDHKQLPAVVVQSPAQSAVHDPELHTIGLTDCRRSFFERMHEQLVARGEEQRVGMLHRQGRMHQDIGTFASRHYYGGRLDIVPLPHQTAPLGWRRYNADIPLQRMLAQQRMLCFDVPHAAAPGAKSNTGEADLAALVVSSVAALCRTNGQPLEWARRLGIIVPFRGQILCLRRALAALDVPEAEDISIDTVERYQGSQRDIILFSTVVSTPEQLALLSAPVETGGQLVDRKLNVAVTRAREQFVLVGNLRLLDTCTPYHELLEYIRRGAQGGN